MCRKKSIPNALSWSFIVIFIALLIKLALTTGLTAWWFALLKR